MVRPARQEPKKYERSLESLKRAAAGGVRSNTLASLAGTIVTSFEKRDWEGCHTICNAALTAARSGSRRHRYRGYRYHVRLIRAEAASGFAKTPAVEEPA